jgi:phage tail sheath protein FI
MVPPSTIALRTIAYNDQVAYQWFAPAGFTRGLVFNASSVGYLNAEGEYQPVILNQGQRDILYLNKINPIAYIPNRGLVVYGQKTLSPSASALDRVNVARLANYLRYNLDNIAKPFLFQPNDMQTRDAFKATIERFLVGLVGLRAIEDFAVVCDESNNTAERRNRNELWCDMFIAPEKAVEFIYLPVRIRNSGDSLS